ncbi:MAG: cache domain-containing protein [bacterium]|nr:cache domain-containing protein [bacterium]
MALTAAPGSWRSPGNSGRVLAGQDLVAGTYAELDRVRDVKLGQLKQYLAAGRLAGRPGVSSARPVPPRRAADRVQDPGEADRGSNLFTGPWRDSALTRRLRMEPAAAFVDYEHYEATGEPSAFFVQPIELDGAPAGWLILQCTIDKLNRIFDRGDYLGQTGEVFLVNRDRLMLTDSRFQSETSILRQHLSEQNISAKFAEGRGHKIITDYRGQRALTSFEVCPVLDKEWLLIAKIDEDEVVTRAWNRSGLEAMLMKAAAARQPAGVAPPRETANLVRVDMDEFHRVKPGAALLTYGVSTCTGIVITRPGHFGYLGHASTYDRCYGAGDIDLVAQMLKRIRQFEVYPSELRELRAVIVAPHVASARGVIERLLDAGILLSQITFVRDPGAPVRHDRRGPCVRTGPLDDPPGLVQATWAAVSSADTRARTPRAV